MARPPRFVAADAIYHLTCRGVRKLPIFHADRDRALFLALLRRALARYGWLCQAYCLLDNHWHVVVQTEQPTLSVGMHWLNTAYARTFNKRHGFEGHLFDGRFGSKVIESSAQLMLTARYVELNPVRAGLVSDPGDWPWSSYRFHAGRANSSLLGGSWLLDLFGKERQKASAAYIGFVLDGAKEYVTPVSAS
jgi:REP element-mobilizing transposase RayT